MIDGLKLTFTGDELRRLLLERAETHRAAIARIRIEQSSGHESTSHCPLPEHIVEEMVDRHEWRGEVLDFIRAHIETAETYRLGNEDLDFAELLPRASDAVEQEEYDSRSRLAYQVGRLATELAGLGHSVFKMALVDADRDDDSDAP